MQLQLIRSSDGTAASVYRYAEAGVALIAARAPTAFETVGALVNRRNVSLKAPMESPIYQMGLLGGATRGLAIGRCM